MEVREADARDAEAMSDVLQELVAAGRRANKSDVAFCLSHYIEHPDQVHCFVAVDEHGKVHGFQSLKIAEAGNPYDTPIGWGIIGTHVRPSAGRRGVGSRLFAVTLPGACKAQLPAIEAYIDEQNAAALAYYEAMSFRTHRRPAGIICKMLRVVEILRQ